MTVIARPQIDGVSPLVGLDTQGMEEPSVQGQGSIMKTSTSTQAVSHATPLHDRIEFRLLIAVSLLWFLVVAAVSRLLPRKLRPLSSRAARGESLFAEARRTAYTVIPYAFMR